MAWTLEREIQNFKDRKFQPVVPWCGKKYLTQAELANVILTSIYQSINSYNVTIDNVVKKSTRLFRGIFSKQYIGRHSEHIP